jgi:hypothetical protein
MQVTDMDFPGLRHVDEAVMPVLNEREMAGWRRESGGRIVARRGRYWLKKHHGFFQGVHWLARMNREEARRPALACYGFRVALVDADAGLANGSVPVHLLSRLDDYDLEHLPRKRRNKLRKCQKNVTIVQVTAPDILAAEGHAVRRSVTERLGIWAPPPEPEYRAGLPAYVGESRRLILAGLVDGRLGGYLEAEAAEGTAYVERVYIATEALHAEIGTGLVYELVQACRRSGRVREIVYGLDYRPNESLREFKYAMGFPVVHVPARVWMAPLVGRLIRRRAPGGYYWLVGQKPGQVDVAPGTE